MATDQLFSTRLDRFCPGAHCQKACGPDDCTCKPCPRSCPFCKARRAEARAARTPVRFETGINFEHRQPRLFGGLERSNT